MIESNVGTEIAHGMTRDRVLCSQPQGRPPTRPCTEQASLSPVDGQAGVAEHGVKKRMARRLLHQRSDPSPAAIRAVAVRLLRELRR